ncbi:hypothetical protein [Paenibacillus sinopodophylli]|uniref:hypothetical protein n=1 Tax=Paenibacillus sinopodophylli TaxID=1837342 RepID=UPI00110C9598|nr:hypothetical protein [Paenibacillus sinopodophylli]
MSYNIHITRASYWANNEEEEISLEEVQNYFVSKNGFVYASEFSITGPITMTVQGHFFIWKTEEKEIPFMFSEGNLTIPYGDDEVLEKMKEIAIELHAVVQGDEGEIY